MAQTQNRNEASAVIASFAAGCERLNEYARSLQNEQQFKTVRTGADIRNYQTGWRLEKWVEAELNPEAGQWAAWWIELGAVEDAWKISVSLSISHGDCFISLPDRIARSANDLQRQLTAAIDELVAALDKNQEFAGAVKNSKLR